MFGGNGHQREAKRLKEEQASAAGAVKATESLVDALYYYEKWGSAACWRTEAQMGQELEKLKSKSAKLAALKEQVRIRVLGLG